jgi:hypothetical protein
LSPDQRTALKGLDRDAVVKQAALAPFGRRDAAVGPEMTSYLFSGGRFLDPRKDALQDGISVLVEDGLV